MHQDGGAARRTEVMGSWRKRPRNSPIPAAAPSSAASEADGFPPLLHSVPAPDIQARFEALTRRWREETEFHSAASALFMHPAYQEIIGLGPAVLPLMLADLEKTRDHWFWALRAITGDNPVPAEERGKVEQMAERWVDWGRARGLL